MSFGGSLLCKCLFDLGEKGMWAFVDVACLNFGVNRHSSYAAVMLYLLLRHRRIRS